MRNCRGYRTRQLGQEITNDLNWYERREEYTAVHRRFLHRLVNKTIVQSRPRWESKQSEMGV